MARTRQYSIMATLAAIAFAVGLTVFLISPATIAGGGVDPQQRTCNPTKCPPVEWDNGQPCLFFGCSNTETEVWCHYDCGNFPLDPKKKN